MKASELNEVREELQARDRQWATRQQPPGNRYQIACGTIRAWRGGRASHHPACPADCAPGLANRLSEDSQGHCCWVGLAQGHIHHGAEALKLCGELVDNEWKGQVHCSQGFLLCQGWVCMPEQHLVKAMCLNCYILVPLPDLVSTGERGDPFGEILGLMSVAGQPGLEEEFVELLHSQWGDP